ncbi:PAS domain-containing protein [Klenkia terrae]|uniref:PAS domain-containing protein n=1 Tax=Klenkia terrae TaxID=1052259 RepID=UPI0036084914
MHPTVDRAAPAPPAPHDWAEVARRAPDGLAVVDADGRWLQLNPTAEELCDVPAAALVGTASPFRPTPAVSPQGQGHGLLDDDGAELVCSWTGGRTTGVREFAYRTHLLDAGTGSGWCPSGTPPPSGTAVAAWPPWPGPRPGWPRRVRCPPPWTPSPGRCCGPTRWPACRS